MKAAEEVQESILTNLQYLKRVASEISTVVSVLEGRIYITAERDKNAVAATPAPECTVESIIRAILCLSCDAKARLEMLLDKIGEK